MQERLPDGMGTAGAGRGHAEAGTAQPMGHGDKSSRHIGDQKRQQVRRNSSRPTGAQGIVPGLDIVEPAQTNANLRSHSGD